jgi:hypothetical protein
MNSEKAITTWLVLGPIYEKAHQTDRHFKGDDHPLAADIINDIDRNPLDPIKIYVPHV